MSSRVAIVTGGASGLGAAVSGRLASDGFHVVIADRDGAGAAHVAEAVNGTAIETDVREQHHVAAMVNKAAALGDIKVLVLSAAVETRTSIVDTTDEQWRDVMDTNLKGPFLCMRAVVPAMIGAGGGSIVALGSTLGQIVAPGYPAYCASKFALTNLCKQVAIEHAAAGVRVNVVAPSACDTGLFVRVAEASGDREAIERMVTSNVPMGRLGTAREVCDAVAFFASDASSYTSGTVLPLDGGLAARRM
ncbi:MAG TPA: SDR family oxidoreductase [Acidimicrobiales bacterium]|nr:SDR family oxidoreductase [Acidimicrobiales bacterium]